MLVHRQYYVLVFLFYAVLQCRNVTCAMPTNLDGNDMASDCRTEKFQLPNQLKSPLPVADRSGNEKLNSISKTSPMNRVFPAKITFAAYNKAALFVNGRLKGSTKFSGQVTSIGVNVRRGDVIAIKARSKGRLFGAIVDIKVQNKHFVTGQQGWKAIRGYKKEAKNPRGWNSRRFSSCQWPDAIFRPQLRHPHSRSRRRRNTFPSQYGAKYVWAKGAHGRSAILLRFVIAGERCRRSSSLTNSKITFAADNQAWVFVNNHYVGSSRHWSQVVNIPVNVKAGDVIAIKCQDWGGWYGFIADLVFQGKRYVTGSHEWKAIQGSVFESRNPPGWKTAAYSSCRWPSAIVLPRASKVYPGKAPSFPYKNGAKYVWAKGAGSKSSILVRLVIGGENCAGSSNAALGSITFAADDRAWVYVNRKYVGAVSHFAQVRRVQSQLRKGAVIAVKAQDLGGWFGVAVDIFLQKKHIGTGQKGWKAIQGSISEAQNPRGWMLPSYSSCHWAEAVLRSDIKKYSAGMARGFPYDNGAKYVWAKGSRGRDTVLFRYVIGGERCGAPNGQSLSKITFATGSRGWLFANAKFLGMVGRSSHIRDATLKLEAGDVVSIRAQDLGGLRGIIANIEYGGKNLMTGQTGWKAIKGSLNEVENPSGWMLRSFNGCKWPAAVTLPHSAKLIPTNVRRRLYGLGARYVWARNANKMDSVLVRFVVGGEKCAAEKPKFNGEIHLAADNGARVFVNGKEVGKVNGWREVLKCSVNLKMGDVIAVEALDSGVWFGVKVVVKVGKKVFVTGKSVWKGTSRLEFEKDLNKNSWMRREFAKGCEWKNVVKRPDAQKKFASIAPSILGTFGGHYVWANGSMAGERVFLRFVVGGDICKRTA